MLDFFSAWPWKVLIPQLASAATKLSRRNQSYLPVDYISYIWIHKHKHIHTIDKLALKSLALTLNM